jgi:hypothetical protein
MAVITNRNTQQTPITLGRTGAQSIRFIPGPRVYMRTADSTSAAPVQNYYTKSNGTTPSGWTDLGIVSGVVTLTYEKEIKDIETGIDQVLRLSYVGKKTAGIEFSLGQFDDVALETISGLTASVIVAGSTVAYKVGSEDLIQRAVMFVVQNKIDGKEWQFYNPNALLSFQILEEDDALVLKANGRLPAFQVAGAAGSDPELFIHSTIYA